MNILLAFFYSCVIYINYYYDFYFIFKDACLHMKLEQEVLGRERKVNQV